ncbi:MAG: chorismate mutase [Rhizobiaceae bacterium]
MKTESLTAYRADIDRIDQKIVALFAQRFDIASNVAAFKRREGLAVRLQDRIDEVLDRVGTLAKENGAEPEAIRAIYRTVIETTCQYEEAKIAKAG